MSPVDEERAEDRIDDRIDGRLNVKEQRAGRIEQHVEAHRKAPDRKVAAALAEAKADDIEPAGRAAAGECKPQRKAAQDAADHAGRQALVEDRRGDDAQKERRRAHADERADEEAAPELPPAEKEHRHIQKKIEDTGDIHARRQRCALREHRSEDLAQAHHAAGIQSDRHDEKVDAHRVKEGRKDRDRNARPLVLHSLVQHSVFLLFRPAVRRPWPVRGHSVCRSLIPGILGL